MVNPGSSLPRVQGARPEFVGEPPDGEASPLEVVGSARIDVGRELALVLRQTSDQLQHLAEGQDRLAGALSDTRALEATHQTLKSLNYIFRELSDSQLALARELARERSRGRTWMLVAVVIVAATLVVGALILQSRQQDAAADAHDAALAEELRAAAAQVQSDSRALTELGARLAKDREEELADAFASERKTLEEQAFQAESRLAEVTRDRDQLANSQRAMSDSLVPMGEELVRLRGDNQAIRLELERAQGLLAAAAVAASRPPVEPVLGSGALEFSPPQPDPSAPVADVPVEAPTPPAVTSPAPVVAESTPSLPATPPPSEASTLPAATPIERYVPPGLGGAPAPVSQTPPVSQTQPVSQTPTLPPAPAPSAAATRSSVPARPAPAAGVTLADLFASEADGLGLELVSATPGQRPGTFKDVEVIKRERGQIVRRYRGDHALLLLDGRGKGLLRLTSGMLTMVAWQGGRPLEREVPLPEFDLQINVLDLDLWKRAGAIRERDLK